LKLIPNLLSAARLALAPYLFLLLWRRQYPPALALCFIAGITDGLDGLLARRLKAASKLGAYLDPVADKILLSGIFLTLAIDGAIGRWLAGLVFGRDLFILAMAGAAFAFTKIRSFPPTVWGKLSTAAQIAFVLALLAHFSGFVPLWCVQVLKWSVAGLAVVSGVHYGWIGTSELCLAMRSASPAAGSRGKTPPDSMMGE